LLPRSIGRLGYQQNIGSRKEQQDSFRLALGSNKGKPALLAVLADGMGGMSDGAACQSDHGRIPSGSFSGSVGQFEHIAGRTLGVGTRSEQSRKSDF
jgi:hypothetical protein